MAPQRHEGHAPVQYCEFGGVMGYVGGNEGVPGSQSEERPPRLLDEVRRVLRLKHYSLRTEHAYVAWERRFGPVQGA